MEEITETKKETLLIIDDSLVQRTIFREMLGDFFQLIEAASGEEGLSLIEHANGKIDLVILDLVMPGVDGFEVLRRKPKMDTFKDIPVIILTTNESEEFQIKAFELGANEFIIKPVNPTIALSRIHNVLETQRRFKSILKEQERLKGKTEIDEMTNLYNKVTTEKLVTTALREHRGRTYAMLMVDIDNFKAINDTYGHKMGDHVICVIAGVLSSYFSEEDIVGRIGGDEFIVLLQNFTSKSDVYQRAQEILWKVRDKEQLSIPEGVSVSIGLTFSNGLEKGYETMREKADEALYHAKKEGRDCVKEYGEELHAAVGNHQVLVWSGSRNTVTMLMFSYPPSMKFHQISSILEYEQVEKSGQKVGALYIDVSECADDGEKIWEEVKIVLQGKKVPVIAICREGNMKQIRYAAESGLVQDLLFAPLESDTLNRRVRAHLSLANERTKKD